MTKKKKAAKRAKKLAPRMKSPTAIESPTADAAAYLYPEGRLTVLSVDADREFRLPPRSRTLIAEAAQAISGMLQQGYTLLVADRAERYLRVHAYDAKQRAYVVGTTPDTRFVLPISRARALGLPRQAGG
jgi:hypothetical protein